MSFTVESKSQLARLMATENLHIQHIKAQTASFDPIKRVLYLPIWKDMTGVIYDLLTGHEVGHAQYTPADGWHSAATDKSKNKSYKGFLNVVEDARIEKKIQRKYPGLRSSFKSAYQELMKRDFFGVANRDIDTLAFIDRLNLYSKSQWTLGVSFNAQETKMVQKVRDAETWEEVVKIADEIFEYSKEEQQELQMSDFQFSFDSSYSDSDEDDNEEDEGEGEEIEDDGELKANNSECEEDEDGEESEDDEGGLINHNKKSKDCDFEPVCATDDNYRKNEMSLLDEKSKDYCYYSIPKPNIENIIVPHNIVHLGMDKSYHDQGIDDAKKNSLYMEFKKNNERYINLLVKEFEMRKAAKSFSRSRLSDTGEIDVSKLSTYRFDDNIFRKMLLVPKGKSHGLVLLLDKSGSMQDILGNSIDQILILTMFCRKVNIPFVVYGFGNSIDGFISDLKNSNKKDIPTGRANVHEDYKSFEWKENSIAFSNVRLREYLNSNMSVADFTKSVKNMLILRNCFKYRREYYPPATEFLSNTPLTQAIVALADVTKQFKRKNNLDILNLVIVHDGDADYTTEVCKTVSSPYVKAYRSSVEMQFAKTNCFIVDEKTKFCRKVDYRDEMHPVIMEWFKMVTGCKIFSFYLSERTSKTKNLILAKKSKEITLLKVEAMMKQFKKENYVSLKVDGYDNFFITTPMDVTEDDSFESLASDAESLRSIKTAFSQFNKKRSVSRAMVGQFIQGIAL